MTTFMIKGSFGGLTFYVKLNVIGEFEIYGIFR